MALLLLLLDPLGHRWKNFKVELGNNSISMQVLVMQIAEFKDISSLVFFFNFGPLKIGISN